MDKFDRKMIHRMKRLHQKICERTQTDLKKIRMCDLVYLIEVHGAVIKFFDQQNEEAKNDQLNNERNNALNEKCREQSQK